MRKMCTVEGCGKFLYARGYCTNHYQVWRRNGNPYGQPRSRTRPDGTRNCTKCGAIKDLSEFGANKLGADGVSPWCRACMRSAQDANKAADVDRYRAAKADREARRRAAKLGVKHEAGITREALRLRDGDECNICGEVMDFNSYTRTTRPKTSASVDHILPLSRGGGHTWENVALCCLVCNMRKGARIANGESLTTPSNVKEYSR